jgi:hypothetical protein
MAPGASERSDATFTNPLIDVPEVVDVPQPRGDILEEDVIELVVIWRSALWRVQIPEAAVNLSNAAATTRCRRGCKTE